MDRDGTRATLENAIVKEIGRRVKLDLRLRKTPIKSAGGKTIAVEIVSVTVDSRQVSEAVKGLRSVLHKNLTPPTGREMYLITQTSNDEARRKADLLLQKHLKIVQQECRSYSQTGMFVKQPVHLKQVPATTVIIQQKLCSLKAKNGKQLFTGVERMGNSTMTLFTHTQENTAEARKTIRALPLVLQAILADSDYNKIRGRINGSTVAELIAVQQVDNTYLDDLLTIHHYTNIDVTRKRKKVDDGNDGGIAVSGLTQVSQTSSEVNSSTTAEQTGSQPEKAVYAEVMKSGTSGNQARPLDMITILQQQLDQQSQFIEQMQKETATIQKSMDLIQKNIPVDQKKEEAHQAWQTAITEHLKKTNKASVRQDKSIAELHNHANQTAKTLQ